MKLTLPVDPYPLNLGRRMKLAPPVDLIPPHLGRRMKLAPPVDIYLPPPGRRMKLAPLVDAFPPKLPLVDAFPPELRALLHCQNGSNPGRRTKLAPLVDPNLPYPGRRMKLAPLVDAFPPKLRAWLHCQNGSNPGKDAFLTHRWPVDLLIFGKLPSCSTDPMQTRGSISLTHNSEKHFVRTKPLSQVGLDIETGEACIHLPFVCYQYKHPVYSLRHRD